ncbi:MAG TPA: ABC transporter transmembrane domain-containing protein, partial [Candidatus Hodarchaeales archaeon]|nr:ABC transporter transmembrane domain-containing protein [Candidatus Hodarchaeales archaeon]
MAQAFHADAEAESPRGKFGYSDKQLYRFMLHYAFPYKRELAAALALMLAVSIFTITGPLILMRAVDRFTETDTSQLFGVAVLDDISFSFIDYVTNVFPTIPRTWVEIALLAVAYFIVQIGVFIFTSRQSVVLGSVGIKATQNIRHDLFTHLQELDMGYHDRNEVGRTMSRTTSDVEAIREFLGGAIVENVLNFFTVFAIAVLVFLLDPVLSIVAFSLIPLIILTTALARRYSRPRRKEVRRTNAMLMAYLGENIAGIKVTKALSREERNKEIFAKLNASRKIAQIRANTVNVSMFTTLLFFSSLGAALLVIVGGF